MSTSGYRDTVNDTEEVLLRSLNKVRSFLTSTSSSFTYGSDLAINEIFNIAIKILFRHGVSSPVFHTGDYYSLLPYNYSSHALSIRGMVKARNIISI